LIVDYLSGMELHRRVDEPHPSGRPELAESDLVRRAQLGSSAAFEQLVLRRGPHLSRYLAVRLNERYALDVFQETVTAAWQGLPNLEDPSKFWPWLVGIATHKAADASREQHRAAEQGAEPTARVDESMLEVREALAALPEAFRQVLLLRYFLDLSEEEVAVALRIRVGTVKSRSARARRALLELLR
jgi:RNA polymerase sigma factor (sigma-70 family)